MQNTTKIKLFIPAGAATATPPLGPILGQYGINTSQFCKEFNEETAGLDFFFNESFADSFDGFVLVVDIYIHEDRSYSYVIKKPPTSFLIRLLAGVKIGAPQSLAGTLTSRELVCLARFKLSEIPILQACQILAGTARSIGVRVVR